MFKSSWELTVKAVGCTYYNLIHNHILFFCSNKLIYVTSVNVASEQ